MSNITYTPIQFDSADRSPLRRRDLLGATAASTLLLGAGLSTPALAEGELRTMTGDATGLMDNLEKDKWNLVMLWSVTCSICAQETPTLSALYMEEKESGGNITLLGVSIDGPDMTTDVASWMQRHDMKFPNLVGEFIQTAANFEALTKERLRGTPTFLLFDTDGKLAAVQPGPLRPEALRKFVASREASA